MNLIYDEEGGKRAVTERRDIKRREAFCGLRWERLKELKC